MEVSLKTQLFIILIVALFQGCRSRETTSQTKHIAGELKRDNIIALNNGGCADSDPSVYSFGNLAPQPQTDYLRKIFKKIVEGSPEVFTGPYAPENFCIRAIVASLNFNFIVITLHLICQRRHKQSFFRES